MGNLTELVAHVTGFIDVFAKATPWILIVGGWLAYYYREKLKQILARSLAIDVERLKADLAKEHADYTANLQRELEAYKVSLIAETERSKAKQDIRKSIALKVAERKYYAVAALMDAHAGLDTSISSHVCIDGDSGITDIDFLRGTGELHDRLATYSKSSDEAILFVDAEIRGAVLKMRRSAASLLGRRLHLTDPVVPKNDKSIQELFSEACKLEDKLRGILREFELMDD